MAVLCGRRPAPGNGRQQHGPQDLGKPPHAAAHHWVSQSSAHTPRTHAHRQTAQGVLSRVYAGCALLVTVMRVSFQAFANDLLITSLRVSCIPREQQHASPPPPPLSHTPYTHTLVQHNTHTLVYAGRQVMADIGRVDDCDIPECKDSLIDLVRVACYAHQVPTPHHTTHRAQRAAQRTAVHRHRHRTARGIARTYSRVHALASRGSGAISRHITPHGAKLSWAGCAFGSADRRGGPAREPVRQQGLRGLD